MTMRAALLSTLSLLSTGMLLSACSQEKNAGDGDLAAVDAASGSPDLVGTITMDAASGDDLPATTNPDLGGDLMPSPTTRYLHTSGGDIRDGKDQIVRLTGINWFGFETDTYAPHGLHVRSLDALLDTIETLGYNFIRLPYSNAIFASTSMPNGIDFGKNPALQNKTALEVLDAVIAGAKTRGLRVVLDRHRPDAYAQSELWFTNSVSEAQWIADWETLVTRYRADATVIGVDLHNEPHGAATWGDGVSGTDWRLAAERAGNAILAINPELLIIVEGIEHVGSDYYWWGGQLASAENFGVRLDVDRRLVYSAHDYPASLYAQSWFSAGNYPANLPGVWDAHWGYLAQQDIAPVLLGEFGTKLETTSDQQWLATLVDYLDDNALSFSVWCLNPNSSDTGGILQDDWTTVNTNKHNALQPILAPKL